MLGFDSACKLCAHSTRPYPSRPNSMVLLERVLIFVRSLYGLLTFNALAMPAGA
jgi:hypothetical protein